MTEPAPASEAAESIFPNNNNPASLYCAEAGAPPSSPYPILHLPSLPQHHLGNMAQRILSSERIRDLDNLAENGYLLEIFTENVDRSILQISFRLIFTIIAWMALEFSCIIQFWLLAILEIGWDQ